MFNDVSEVQIALMTEAVSTYETSANYQDIRCNIPEETHLQTRRRENLTSHLQNNFS
jgi:hypothetical protein